MIFASLNILLLYYIFKLYKIVYKCYKVYCDKKKYSKWVFVIITEFLKPIHAC